MGLLQAIRGALFPPVPPGGEMAEWTLTHDRLHEFSAAGEMPWRAEVRVRVWTELSGGCPPMVMITDLGRGARVSPWIEAITATVSARLALPPGTIWIVHVPARGSGGELYQVVTFPPPPAADVRDLTAAERSWVKTLEDTREE